MHHSIIYHTELRSGCLLQARPWLSITQCAHQPMPNVQCWIKLTYRSWALSSQQNQTDLPVHITLPNAPQCQRTSTALPAGVTNKVAR